MKSSLGLIRAAEILAILLGSELLLSTARAVASALGVISLSTNEILTSSYAGMAPYCLALVYAHARRFSIGLVSRESSFRPAIALITLTPLVAGAFTLLQWSVAGGEPASNSRDTLGSVTALGVEILVAPIFEEMVFRGVIMVALLSSFGPRAAVIVSATIFSLLHLRVADMPSAMLVGLITGAVLLWSQRILACVVAHVAWNTAAVVSWHALMLR